MNRKGLHGWERKTAGTNHGSTKRYKADKRNLGLFQWLTEKQEGQTKTCDEEEDAKRMILYYKGEYNNMSGMY